MVKGFVGSEASERDRSLTGGIGEPWLTRDFLTHFESLDTSAWVGWEWGCGDSTRWFASRVGEWHSIDNSQEWYERCLPGLPPNARLRYAEAPEYHEAILQSPTLYDVVVVDGRFRNECLVNAVQRTKPGGMIVLDNANRARYAEGRAHVHARAAEYHPTTNGHWRTDFWVMGPDPVTDIS